MYYLYILYMYIVHVYVYRHFVGLKACDTRVPNIWLPAPAVLEKTQHLRKALWNFSLNFKAYLALQSNNGNVDVAGGM